ncbi:MAG: SDR family oxidoreductase [Novosphingobium sp.]|nr:SDR family oxidoreductase [Novosphingobium sp.]MCP5403174.1 SDR family oxidoreductase [Novosphingobium sp.]
MTGMLQGKTAVVTGAGTGIGRVIARRFVAEGARVLVSDFSGEQEDTAAELGEAAVAFQADVRHEAEIEEMFAQALEALGRLDISVHVAGNPGGRWGEEITEEEFDAFTQTHLKGMMFCCKHAARAMLPAGGGAIVNFSSTASLNYDPLISFGYSAAKAGINSLTKGFAGRYGKDGIRVNAIAPGFTLSEKNRNVPEQVMASLSARAMLGRAGTPEEQASVALFLASDLASFVTGLTIPVDGGWTARLA